MRFPNSKYRYLLRILKITVIAKFWGSMICLPWPTLCSILSGAIYGLHPTFVFAIEFIRFPAIPKSHNLISIFESEFLFRRIFDGFTSRWITDNLSLRYFSADRTAKVIAPKVYFSRWMGWKWVGSIFPAVESSFLGNRAGYQRTDFGIYIWPQSWET